MGAFVEDDIEMDEEDIRREKEAKKFLKMVRKSDKKASPEAQIVSSVTRRPQLILHNTEGEIVEPPRKQKKQIDYNRELRRWR